MLTVEKIRELAAAGVKNITVVVDDPDAQYAALIDSADDVWSAPRWSFDARTIKGEPVVWRRRQASLLVEGVVVFVSGSPALVEAA